MLKAELYKMRKNRIFYICALTVILPAIFIIYKDTVLATPPDQISEWIQSVNVITSLFLTIASGFVITFLIQREYEDKSIINVLLAPISRRVFLISKLLIWLLWYILVLGISMAIYMLGGKLVYSGRFHTDEVMLLLNRVATTSMLSFITSTPLVFIAVKQRKTFYPSIMFSLIITGIELSAMTIPVKFGSLIPWSAAMLLGYGINGVYTINLIIAIATAAIFGILGGCITFQRQNQ